MSDLECSISESVGSSLQELGGVKMAEGADTSLLVSLELLSECNRVANVDCLLNFEGLCRLLVEGLARPLGEGLVSPLGEGLGRPLDEGLVRPLGEGLVCPLGEGLGLMMLESERP